MIDDANLRHEQYQVVKSLILALPDFGEQNNSTNPLHKNNRIVNLVARLHIRRSVLQLTISKAYDAANAVFLCALPCT